MRHDTQFLTEDGYEEMCLNATKRVINNKINEQKEYQKVFNLTNVSQKKGKNFISSYCGDSIMTPFSLKDKL
jgi:hypothetical protein